VILLEPESSKQHSKIELKNPWISHPTLQQRISHILSNDINQDINTDSALSLIPIALINAISDSVFENADYATYKRANDDEYVSLLSSEIEERSFAIDVRPFFNRDICPFNPHEIKPEDGEIKSPLNEDNAKFVMEYEQAIADYRTMMQFKNKQIKGKVIRYEGKVYNRKNMPIDQQAEYLRLLNNKVKTIDMLVCRYALTVVENRALIIKAYDDIFYSQYIIEKIKNNLFSNRAALTRDLSRIKRRDENDFLELQRNLISFKKSIMDAIANIEMDRLRPVAHVDMWKKFSYFMKTETIFAGSSILSEEINYVFSIPDELIQLFENLEYYSKKIISDCMSGKEPLMAWDNSVSAQNNKSE
jgi:hypothetical protein